MIDRLARLYDNATGVVLITALLLGILLGGLFAFDPQPAAEQHAAENADPPTPTSLPPTPVSINVPAEPPAAEIADAAGESNSGPAEDFITAAALQNGWNWRSPETLTGRQHILADGTIVLEAESGAVYFINPDGSPRASLAGGLNEGEERIAWSNYYFDDMSVLNITAERVFAIHPDLGLRWEFPVEITSEEYWPQYYPGDNFRLIVDTANNMYAFTLEDGLLWTYSLDGVPNGEYLTVATGSGGVFYAAEAGGNLFAFDRNGVKWSFDPGENLRAASDPVVGADGRVYYVITSGTFGTLISLGPDGSERWRTRLDTFRFYEAPSISAGGVYVYVDEDFVAVESGRLTALDFPYTVDAIYSGEDGYDYLITGHHIIRWRIGPDGFEQLNDIVVNLENFGGFFAPFLHIHPDGLIEFRLFTDRESQLVWIDSNTAAVEVHSIPYSQILFRTRTGEIEFTRCDADADSSSISCAKNIPGLEDSVWSLTIDGIFSPTPGFSPAINYIDGRLYIMPDPLNLYAFDLEIP